MKGRWKYVVLLLLLVFRGWANVVSPGIASEEDVIVELGPDQYLVGAANRITGQQRFLGVPFAQPPVGSLRWRSPRPEKPWVGLRSAKTLGNSCMQGASAWTVGTNISEDCLYANVYAPSNASSLSLPVMLWFYGGSWKEGSASCFLYWGQHLVAETESVIVVTANYRLGSFGFLGGEALREQDCGDDGEVNSTGNWGFLDQRRAMAWVQEHISAFGGDPSRVTIFGESAGAGSTATHLVSKGSWAASTPMPLFHAAIMESGSPAAPWNSQNMSFAEHHLRGTAFNVGCTASEDEAVGAEAVACLRNASSAALYEARSNLGGSFLTWSPVEDGVVLERRVSESLAAGEVAFNVTIMLGSNGDEGTEFSDLPFDADDEDYRCYMAEILGPDLADQVLRQYPASEFNASGVDGKWPGHGPYWAAARAFGDGFFTCPARRTVRQWASSNRTKAFLYFFNESLSVLDVEPAQAEQMGVFHGSEMIFLWGPEKLLRTEDELELGAVMRSFWSFFAENLDPNFDGAPAEWLPYDETKDSDMRLVAPVLNGVSMTSGLKRDVCDFWDDQGPIPSWVLFGET